MRDVGLQKKFLSRKRIPLKDVLDEATAAETSEKAAAVMVKARGIHKIHKSALTSSDDSTTQSESDEERAVHKNRKDNQRTSKRSSNQSWRGEDDYPRSRTVHQTTIAHTSDEGTTKFHVTLMAEGSPCKMEVDSGSAYSIMDWQHLQQLKPSCKKTQLKTPKSRLVDFNGNPIGILGRTTIHIKYKDFNGELPITIVENSRPNLLGVEWFKPLGLSIEGIHEIHRDELDTILEEFKEVFDGKLGKFVGRPISFNLDKGITPIRLKPCRVPFALRPKVDEQLDKLIAQGVLEPIDHASWETPIVTPLKHDGSVRICADYRCTINKALAQSAYPVPVVQHLLHSLAEAQTIVTHRGAFKCNRLQFGVSAAPGIFQSMMERLLQGVPGVVPYFDDVLVSGDSRAQLLERLRHHKPLLGLLAGDQPTPTFMSPRMTRWAIFLAGYSYRLVHQPGTAIGNANALSRCPSKNPVEDPAPMLHLFHIDAAASCPVSSADVAVHTQKDPTLCQVKSWILRGWPSEKTEERFSPFARKQKELSTIKGCLLWGDRVLIPSTLQRRTLETLHKGHPGIVRMKALARSYVWWPSMDRDIEQWVSRCDPCQEVRPAPPQSEVAKWETPSNPWSRIHIDFAGPMQGRHLLIVVDAFSKWLEVVPKASTTTEATIRALRRLFATHGLPDMLVSDNGPQLTSLAMESFLAGLGIRHALSAPYRPAGNGQAERMVRLTKEALTKMRRLRSPLDRLHPQYSPEVTADISTLENSCEDNSGSWLYPELAVWLQQEMGQKPGRQQQVGASYFDTPHHCP
ncbi:uncharacterized protein K02A2.6-like [Pantherophis guttatus]|uniref:Gypsy retrotransposon integrase-like protein 1 n=1 Tax=Pantherophis guttatus TaxID=94885 RepID=A0ABM3Z212_PANGU|nr:uncharacterized protein K02A2.6-like [Pantherophis guttatus]